MRAQLQVRCVQTGASIVIEDIDVSALSNHCDVRVALHQRDTNADERFSHVARKCSFPEHCDPGAATAFNDAHCELGIAEREREGVAFAEHRDPFGCRAHPQCRAHGVIHDCADRLQRAQQCFSAGTWSACKEFGVREPSVEFGKPTSFGRGERGEHERGGAHEYRIVAPVNEGNVVTESKSAHQRRLTRSACGLPKQSTRRTC